MVRGTLFDAGYGFIRNRVQAICGLRYSTFRRERHHLAQPIKLYWWDIEPNFGDRFMGDLVYRLFGYRCEWASLLECDLIGAGSILDQPGLADRQQTIQVWGSGFIKPESNGPNRAVFHLVRGALSRSRLPSAFHNIPLGDPGLLANLIYERAQPSGKIGVVPHYVDKESAIIQGMKQDGRFVVLDVADPPSDIARGIASSSLILSSSLHGLIFADSFGVPNAHIILSDGVMGGTYKFRDYFSSVNRTYEAADVKRLFDDDYLESLRTAYVPVRGLAGIQRRMIRSFPYK